MGVAVALLVAHIAGAQPAADLDPIVNRLQAAYERLETLEAKFVQTLHSVSLGRAQEESGVVYLQRPARMRWEYRAPEKKLAVVDGERSWLYIPAENQVLVGSLAEIRRGAVGLFLEGNVDLRRDFVVTAGPADLGGKRTDAITLTPRTTGEEFTRIDVAVSRDHGLPVRIVVYGVLGDRMDYQFSALRTGRKLRSSLFEFEPPDGVEVVLSE